MTIYDVSKKAGVSIATVSRVMNGSGKVSEATKRRVLSVIDEIGYTPNAFARGLNLDSMKTIGILCSDSSDPYLAHAVYHIEKGLRKNNYDFLLCCTGHDHSAKKSALSLLISKRVDAIMLLGSQYVEAEDGENDYIRAAAQKLPVLLINGVLEGANIYCTVCDDYGAIFQITDRMFKNGRKRPVYLYSTLSYSGKQKLRGFQAACQLNRLPFQDELAVHIPHGLKSIESTKEHMAALEQKGILFDSIVASDDILAIGAIKYAKQKGIAIPKKLFISGFNNFNLAECCDPELTSIDNRLKAICDQSIATLMGCLSGCDMPKTSVFAAKIIERGTTEFKSNANQEFKWRD